MRKYGLFLFLTLLLSFGCRQKMVDVAPPQGFLGEFVVEQALLTCFEEGATGEDGVLNCEASAVAAYTDVMILGNDKNSSEVSTMFTANKKQLLAGKMDSPFALKQRIFYAIHKIEDMAFSPDGKHLFITSGFDRLKEGSSEWDTYNTLIAWEILEDNFQILAEVNDHGIKSSKGLRKKFQDLVGTPHVKIEGLMALPGNRLVFGVRERGPSWREPEYVCLFIECGYKIRDGKISLDDDMRINYKFDASPARENLGLSSMTYDPARERIYITTSLEEGPEGGKTFGTYLWALPLVDYNAKKAPQLVRGLDGKPLHLPHKGEGIAKFGDDTFFIIHDNDRTDVPVKLSDGSTVSRKQNEAVYSIIRIVPEPEEVEMKVF